mmetsp:Transcript_4278/g.8819  ORF Transcript_4278/g.8819 Transcript_4278/m.8819 type:complete len:177 (+) Transcript_4278:2-532(+)
MVGLSCLGLVGWKFMQGGDGSDVFRRVVTIKFFTQDLMQQGLILAYLYSWYNDGGLRCQLCLFDVQHCDDEYAFHFGNLVLIGCTLFSSVCNQLLISAKNKKYYDEDEEVLVCFVRTAMLAASILPFTTGILTMQSHLLRLGPWTIMAAGCLCAMGWLVVFCVICLPICSFLDEDF